MNKISIRWRVWRGAQNQRSQLLTEECTHDWHLSRSTTGSSGGGGGEGGGGGGGRMSSDYPL